MKTDLCQNKACFNYLKYSRYCGHINGAVKEKKPLKPRSKKLEEVMKKEYRPKVKEMVEAKTPCVVGSPVCTKVAQGFHHKKGREGKLLTDKKHLIPCCNPCNGFLESNDLWGREKGFKLSKHGNYKREK